MARRIVITPLERPPIEQQAVELCEHKGIGHPDTIVDGDLSFTMALAFIDRPWRVSRATSR